MASKGTALVIGSGASGSSCARSLASAGFDVTLAEHDRWGGTCLWRGCIPKKALYHAASVARTLRAAEQFGSACKEIERDWQTVLAWKWHSQETYAGDQPSSLAGAGIKLAEGTARFLSPDEVEIAGERMNPDHIVIATGSRAIIPPFEGAELADISDDVLRYPEVPESLTVIGGGYIAMEMVGIYASFGTRVTVVAAADRILEMLDADLGDVARRRLEAMGVRFLTSCRATRIEGEEGQLRTAVTDAGGAEAILESERVLLAVGRKPSFDRLDLDAGGVKVDERGMLILDQFQRTTNPKVWAIGDATGGMMQTPIVAAEGRVIATSIESGEPRVPDCSATPITCFTVPQLATVGLTIAEAEQQGIPAEAHRADFDTLGAGVIADERDGFVKIIAEKESGKVLGAQIAANNASDLIYSAAVALRCGATLKQLQDTPGVHPSFAEAVYYAAWR